MVCFDVADPKRLRAVSRILEDFGCRVQHSVFECHLNETDYRSLQKKLIDLIDLAHDHVRYYLICPKDQNEMILDGDSPRSTNNHFHLI